MLVEYLNGNAIISMSQIDLKESEKDSKVTGLLKFSVDSNSEITESVRIYWRNVTNTFCQYEQNGICTNDIEHNYVGDEINYTTYKCPENVYESVSASNVAEVCEVVGTPDLAAPLTGDMANISGTDNIEILPGKIYYVLALTIENKIYTQDYNQGKIFNGRIYVDIYTNETITVEGLVLNDDNVPQSGQEVTLHSDPRTTITDENGYYKFENVPYGSHKVVVEELEKDITLLRATETSVLPTGVRIHGGNVGVNIKLKESNIEITESGKGIIIVNNGSVNENINYFLGKPVNYTITPDDGYTTIESVIDCGEGISGTIKDSLVTITRTIEGGICEVTLKENTNPIVNFDSNNNNIYAKTRTVRVTLTDNKNKIKAGQSIKYLWQPEANCSTNASLYTAKELPNTSINENQVSVDIATTENITGNYYLCIYNNIENEVKNTNTLTKTTGTFALDNTGPVINKIETVSNDTNLEIKVTATDNSSISTYYYAYTAQNTCEDLNYVSATTTTKIFEGLSDGVYKVCVYAKDGLNNLGIVASVSATIDSIITYDKLANSHSCTNSTVGSAPYLMTYNGVCEIIDDSTTGAGNWRVKFKTTGTTTLKFSKKVDVDIFFVGGGGGGGSRYSFKGGGGGGGGYTAKYFGVSLTPTNQSLIVGAGGAANAAGGTTSGFGLAGAAGGRPGVAAGDSAGSGGAGGSGGGGGGHNGSPPTPGNGGSYGNSGSGNARGNTSGGGGQFSTYGSTCEFGEGTTSGCTRGATFAYSGGGGGGEGCRTDTGCVASGSAGYGNGDANTGGGGLGNGKAGYSGVIVIRNKR